MTDRSHMEKPAIVLVAVIGLVLIAVSAPFTVALWDTDVKFDVAWSEVTAGADEQAAAGDSGTATLEIPLTDVQAANLMVSVDGCTDTFQAPLQGPVTLTWTAFRGSEQLESGSGTCADELTWTVELSPQPEQSRQTSADQETAYADVVAGMDNATETIRVEWTWSRAGGSAPALPIPIGATFAATLKAEVSAWTPAVTEPQEDLR